LLPHPTRGVMIERLNNKPKSADVQCPFALFFMSAFS
jgi:hypothetical protein